ncbi:MAG: threonine 3-dehydrogenase [Thermoproteota archaeon]|nr:threonine 3-dehydrogenase [Thermoproteota archaeon]
MKAAVRFKTPGISVIDIPYPTLKPGWVIIKVKASGICGSDVSSAFNPSPEALARFTSEKSYLETGHEFAGEIIEVGEGVSDIQIGDHVTVYPWFWEACGKCRSCLSGRFNECREPGFGQVARGQPRGMSEYTTAPATFVHKLPKNLSWDDAALIEPFTVTFAAVYAYSSFRVGKTAVVLGPGPIGLLILAALKLSTPTLTVVTGTSSDVTPRLDIAKRLGADVTINISEEDPIKRVMELTEGNGVDFVYEAAGIPLISQGIKMLAKKGEYTAIGVPHRETKLDPSDYLMLMNKWGKINAMNVQERGVWFTVIDLMKKGALDIKPVITHHISIDEVQTAYELMQKQQCGKIIVNL